LPVLSATHLQKEYRLGDHKLRALDAVSFSIERGEFVAIMGPSGSGKSTLLHLLGGLDKPSSGEVTLAGQPISVMSDRNATLVRRRNVGFVFQFFNLLPTLSAEENILLPLIIDGKKTQAYRKRLDDLLGLVGLSDRRKHKPDQLSGGEQQRVALARALVTEPAIILADEPTGNLDSRTGTAMMELLQRSCKELNQAIIMVTHDPRAASYADRIVLLKDGRQVEEYRFALDEALAQRLREVIDLLERLESGEGAQ
jgi:putative ABC transport system ATP-binding protein